jgi:hypothetical protein
LCQEITFRRRSLVSFQACPTSPAPRRREGLRRAPLPIGVALRHDRRSATPTVPGRGVRVGGLRPPSPGAGVEASRRWAEPTLPGTLQILCTNRYSPRSYSEIGFVSQKSRIPSAPGSSLLSKKGFSSFHLHSPAFILHPENIPSSAIIGDRAQREASIQDFSQSVIRTRGFIRRSASTGTIDKTSFIAKPMRKVQSSRSPEPEALQAVEI